MAHLKTAMVLGGGGARGAYEAGVIAFLRDELEPGLGRRLPIDIVCGTSVGAINACHVASYSEDPHHQGSELARHWREISVERILRVGGLEVLRLGLELAGAHGFMAKATLGGLANPIGLRDVVLKSVRWKSVRTALEHGALDALAVSATHVSSGRTFVFFETAHVELPPGVEDPHYLARAAHIGPRHALASAAIPLLFPPVRIGGSLFADGGLRLNVPLAPALRLGAQRVIVISLRHANLDDEVYVSENERFYATAPFLAGKTLNALMLDRTVEDLDRLRHVNAILEAGTRMYGSDFPDVLNRGLVPEIGQSMRYVRNILIKPSRDISLLAAEYARSPSFARKAKGLAGRALRHLAEHEARESADLASYLLFDGDFADQLISLGRRDARALGDEWVRFFSEAPQTDAEAAQPPKLAGGGPRSLTSTAHP